MAGGGNRSGEYVRKLPSQAVVETVAAAEGVPPAELRPPEYEPLHAVVDPQALDRLFADRSNGQPRPGGDVCFQFCGYDVTVDEAGSVTLEDGDPSGADDAG
ncbi:HalOD1 output domain-containing protein [Halopiger djelfimassiliensis]|uniref:HalOD1 output domain-containing protein n=1 Tax=Halopiger djelfimassiliensis TaxID=1293047 RepID=UPI0006777C91|nr:HalOD1 output domain-containing protein [Halopiger djelfimassiliensis]